MGSIWEDICLGVFVTGGTEYHKCFALVITPMSQNWSPLSHHHYSHRRTKLYTSAQLVPVIDFDGHG